MGAILSDVKIPFFLQGTARWKMAGLLGRWAHHSRVVVFETH
jgi:hypothetical protein